MSSKAVVFLGSNGYIASACKDLAVGSFEHNTLPFHLLNITRTFLADTVPIYFIPLTSVATSDFKVSRRLNQLVDYLECRYTSVSLILASWPGLTSYSDEIHLSFLSTFIYPFVHSFHRSGILQQIISLGSCLEYGLQEGMLLETNACMPVTLLGKAKCMLSDYVLGLNLASIVHLRIFYPYSLVPRPGTLLDHLRCAYLDGSSIFRMSSGVQCRDFFSVHFLASIILHIAINQHAFRGILNIGSGHPTTVLSLVNAYTDFLGYKPYLHRGFYPLPPYEPTNFWASTSSLESYLATLNIPTSPIHCLPL